MPRAVATPGATESSRPLRIYRNAAGTRVLGVITPIENQPACSNAACHAHPAEQQILGVLDTNLSLAKADVQLAESSRRMIVYTGCALLLIVIAELVFRLAGCRTPHQCAANAAPNTSPPAISAIRLEVHSQRRNRRTRQFIQRDEPRSCKPSTKRTSPGREPSRIASSKRRAS